MTKQRSKIFVGIAGILVIVGFFYSMNSDTLFGYLIKPLAPVDWDEVKTRYIIEYSIPIHLIEQQNGNCLVNAKGFESLTTHGKFIHRAELASKLNFDKENDTLIVTCDKLHGDTSVFTVWYVDSESPTYSGKYEYFIDPYNGTLGRGVDYFNTTSGE